MTQKEKEIQKRIDYIIPKIEAVLRKYPVRKAGLFGSVLRDDFKPEESDIDIALDMDMKGIDLFEYAHLMVLLEESIGTKVDLMQVNSVRKELAPYILPNIQYFYDTNK